MIIGQGLAGSLLGWRLIRAGLSVLVVDAGGNNASRVAAGLVTPVTGRRWVKTTGVDALLPEARAFFRTLGRELGVRVWFEHPVLRLYRDVPERLLARRRRQEGGYPAYLGKESVPGEAGWGLADPYGGCWLQQAARLETVTLLDRLRDRLKAHSAYLERRMEYSAMTLSARGVQWHGLKADRVVFCEGWRVRHNPWFGALPWQPSQGEMLTLESQTPLPPFPVNAGCWLLPLGHGRFRTGATHRWQPLSEAVTATARGQLLAGLAALFQQPPKLRVIGQQAGVRPNTLDHRPILGRHPRHPRLIVCNGFGSKGSLLAPWATRCLAEHLIGNLPLPASAAIGRWRAHLSD